MGRHRIKGWPPPEARRIARGIDWHIYALVDPRDEKIHYVGLCRQYSKRPWAHWSENPEGHRAGADRVAWLDDLRASGRGPYTVRILEVVHELMAAAAAESRWIERGLDEGWPLANMRIRGGIGTLPDKYRKPPICGCRTHHKRPDSDLMCLLRKAEAEQGPPPEGMEGCA